jgi:hypothetical protein
MSQLQSGPPIQKRERRPAATAAAHLENPTNTIAKNTNCPGPFKSTLSGADEKRRGLTRRAIEAGMAFLAPRRPR